LGDHVRLTQRFVDALAGKRAEKKWNELEEEAEQSGAIETSLKTPAVEKGSRNVKKGEKQLLGGQKKAVTDEVWKSPMREKGQDSNGGYFSIPKEISGNGSVNGGETTDGGLSANEDGDEVTELVKDLKVSVDYPRLFIQTLS